MKLSLSHPTANSFVRALAAACRNRRILFRFYTSIACFPGSILAVLARVPGLGELNRRNFDKNLEPVTRSFPMVEAGRLAASKIGFQPVARHETGLFSIDSVYRFLDRKVAGAISRERPDAVYAYEDEALETFRVSKKLGIKCFYDLPIGHWRAARHLLKDEQERRPDWASTLGSFRDSAVKLARKDEELQLADRIFAASTFTARSLAEYPGSLAPVSVVPYGFPPVKRIRGYPAIGTAGDKVKLLFVGGLSQRKGIADLFEAVEILGNRVELTVIGRKAHGSCTALDRALAKHRWVPSMPQQQVLDTMEAHDLLVFPSLFEGFGLVITEAMSRGTPVITTDRTAGPDFIEPGRNGWLVPAGDETALASTLDQILTRPGQIAASGKEAMETARTRPWSAYGKETVDILVADLAGG